MITTVNGDEDKSVEINLLFVMHPNNLFPCQQALPLLTKLPTIEV